VDPEQEQAQSPRSVTAEVAFMDCARAGVHDAGYVVPKRCVIGETPLSTTYLSTSAQTSKSAGEAPSEENPVTDSTVVACTSCGRRLRSPL
jgi:hypothetical protein